MSPLWGSRRGRRKHLPLCYSEPGHCRAARAISGLLGCCLPTPRRERRDLGARAVLWRALRPLAVVRYAIPAALRPPARSHPAATARARAPRDDAHRLHARRATQNLTTGARARCHPLFTVAILAQRASLAAAVPRVFLQRSRVHFPAAASGTYRTLTVDAGPRTFCLRCHVFARARVHSICVCACVCPSTNACSYVSTRPYAPPRASRQFEGTFTRTRQSLRWLRLRAPLLQRSRIQFPAAASGIDRALTVSVGPRTFCLRCHVFTHARVHSLCVYACVCLSIHACPYMEYSSLRTPRASRQFKRTLTRTRQSLCRLPARPLRHVRLHGQALFADGHTASSAPDLF